MTLALLFWIIVIVAIVFGLWGTRNPQYAAYAPWPMFVLIVILGFAVFGFHLTR
jgi:hypothetical protein